jgi:type I restriction enzyme, S subunit
LNTIRLQRNYWIEKTKAQGDTEASVIERKISKLPSIVQEIDGIPASWKNVFLIDATNLVVDCHNKTAPYSLSGIKILRTTNIRDRKIDTSQTNYVTEATYHKWSKRCYPMPGDIIFTREAPVGEAGIIPEDEHVCMGQRQMLIRTFNDLVLNEFLLYALTSRGFLERIQHTLKGAFVKHLRVGDVENAPIPLPPLAEQHIIVTRVNSLMAVIDELEKQVAERKEQAQLLMQTVLREAFEEDKPSYIAEQIGSL